MNERSIKKQKPIDILHQCLPLNTDKFVCFTPLPTFRLRSLLGVLQRQMGDFWEIELVASPALEYVQDVVASGLEVRRSIVRFTDEQIARLSVVQRFEQVGYENESEKVKSISLKIPNQSVHEGTYSKEFLILAKPASHGQCRLLIFFGPFKKTFGPMTFSVCPFWIQLLSYSILQWPI